MATWDENDPTPHLPSLLIPQSPSPDYCLWPIRKAPGCLKVPLCSVEVGRHVLSFFSIILCLYAKATWLYPMTFRDFSKITHALHHVDFQWMLNIPAERQQWHLVVKGNISRNYYFFFPSEFMKLYSQVKITLPIKNRSHSWLVKIILFLKYCVFLLSSI